MLYNPIFLLNLKPLVLESRLELLEVSMDFIMIIICQLGL